MKLNITLIRLYWLKEGHLYVINESGKEICVVTHSTKRLWSLYEPMTNIKVKASLFGTNNTQQHTRAFRVATQDTHTNTQTHVEVAVNFYSAFSHPGLSFLQGI